MHGMKWFSEKYGAILLINMDDIEQIKHCSQQNKGGRGEVHSCGQGTTKRLEILKYSAPVNSRGYTTNVFWSVNKQRHSKQLYDLCQNFSQPINNCSFLHSFYSLLGIWQIWTNKCHKTPPPSLPKPSNKQLGHVFSTNTVLLFHCIFWRVGNGTTIPIANIFSV